MASYFDGTDSSQQPLGGTMPAPAIRTPATSTGLRDAAGTALGRLLDALCDRRRSGRTIILVLVVYCIVWTVFDVLAKASQDIHFDMGEMVAWSREVFLGTPKHPPLPAWIVRAWFDVFPLEPWAYALLAIATAAVALGAAWTLFGDYLDARKRAVAMALLMLIPFFNFLCFRYNANTAMLPWWALTTLFFLRSFETRRSGVAALAGVAAAGAMMVKYWSDRVDRVARARGGDRCPAPALFPLGRALRHRRCRRARPRAARDLALRERFRAIPLCAELLTREPPPRCCCRASLILSAPSAMASSQSCSSPLRRAPHVR